MLVDFCSGLSALMFVLLLVLLELLRGGPPRCGGIGGHLGGRYQFAGGGPKRAKYATGDG